MANLDQVIGEIACGNIKNSAEILSLLQLLPTTFQAKHKEVLEFIDNIYLVGRELGYVGAHLSVSARLTGVPLWTFDKSFDTTNKGLGLSYPPPITNKG